MKEQQEQIYLSGIQNSDQSEQLSFIGLMDIIRSLTNPNEKKLF